MKTKALLLAVLVLLATNADAASITAFTGGSFYTGGTVTISGAITPASVADINILVYDKNARKKAHTQVVTSNSGGLFKKSWPDFNAVDYNVFVDDLNHDVNAKLEFTVSQFADIDINFIGKQPPFQKDANIIFNLQPKDVNGNALSSYSDLNVQLLNSLGDRK